MELRLRCGPAFRDSTLLSLSLSISDLRPAPAAAAAAAVTVSAAFNNRSRARAAAASSSHAPSSRREIRRTSTHSAADSAAADSLCGARVLLRSDIALNKFSAILCAAYAGRPASAPVSVLGFHKEQTSRYSRA